LVLELTAAITAAAELASVDQSEDRSGGAVPTIAAPELEHTSAAHGAGDQVSGSSYQDAISRR
jgi:hypothetical protein